MELMLLGMWMFVSILATDKSIVVLFYSCCLMIADYAWNIVLLSAGTNKMWINIESNTH